MTTEKKTTKTETVTEDDEEVLVIDAEEPEITVEDLPGVGPRPRRNYERLDLTNF